jgi:hypothetical protein
MVKLTGWLTQLTPALVYVATTVIVATAGVVPGFVAIKLGILPTPSGARPMLAPVCTQLYTIVPPVVGLLKLTAAVAVLLHTTWLVIGFTNGVGLTVMVKVIGVPGQPAAVGVTVIVATSGPLVGLVAMNDGISPLPAGARPIAGVLFVQL